MITIEVSINLRPIKTISAVNTLKIDENGNHIYTCYEGLRKPDSKADIKTLHHRRDIENGASVLAAKLLEAFPA